jgi:hypothetical protein
MDEKPHSMRRRCDPHHGDDREDAVSLTTLRSR